MASNKTQFIRGLLGLALAVVLLLGCSSGGSTATPAAVAEPTQPAATDASEPEDEATPQSTDSVSTDQDENADDSAATEASSADPTATAERTLSDEDLASIQDLEAGEQVEDAQGNLIAIYGVAVWPEPFAMLSDSAQAEFPFFGDVDSVADPSSQLVVLDVGMCTAGLDGRGFGTAEFFVHESSTEALSTDPVVGRGVLARHPVARPGFAFPSPAECERGFLPVLWASESTPAVARYVLATRASAADEVEQHVYQWDLAPVVIGDDPDAEAGEAQFNAGQSVTFNEGRLQDTTVMVDGWAELIGSESDVEGTRLVGVSLNYCTSSARAPEFGIGVDRWNIVAPLDSEGIAAVDVEDPATACFEGWLEFAIPFGSVPTAFFASDGVNATVGYAEWSLVDAALPTPQS